MHKLRAVLVGATAIAMVGVPIAANATTKPITQTGEVRISGPDRYTTAVAVSKSTFTAPQTAAFITSGEDFPDALAGGPAAAKLDAPTLLVRKDSMPAEVSAELARLKPTKVYILGGTGAVSDAVSKKIAVASGGTVTRISGSDRYATAAAAAKLVGASSTVYLASGEGFADALAGGAAAAKASAPILLTATKVLPAATSGALKSINPAKVVVLGGTEAVSAAAISQVKAVLPKATILVHAGKDRFETAALLAKAVWPSGSKVVFHAPGLSFPDALGGTPAAKVNNGPILLTQATCTPVATANALNALNPTTQVALGGTAVTHLGTKICGDAKAAVMIGNDISWPQCPSTFPPTSTQFLIVGLTKGLPFTKNPCVVEQAHWAIDRSKPAHAYTMAGFPTNAQLMTYGSSGPWSPSTRAGQLSNVGYAEARDAVATVKAVSGWSPRMIWIDVEPRPAQPWPTGETQRVENRYVLEGLMRGLRDAGYSYGLYSYAAGWGQIVGSWLLPGVPVWAASGTLDYPNEALDKCTQPSFSGGQVYLSQWLNNEKTLDYNRTCEPYEFTKLPMTSA